MPEAGLLERESELDRIEAVLDSAVDGGGGLLVFEGPAGIGKTRLLAEARRLAEVRGMTVGCARGIDLEQDLAYGAVRQLFDPLIALDPDPRALFAGSRACATILGHGDSSASMPAPEAGAVLHALYGIAATLAESSPLVLVCDDAHWIDGPSLRFIGYLANRVDELPVALIVGTRPPEVGPEGELLERMSNAFRPAHISVTPLSEGAVTSLVRSATQVATDDGFCAAVAAASQGNPFLAGELVRTALSAGVSFDSASADSLIELSAGSAVIARMGRLPADALDVARGVAVLGSEAHLRHVAALTGLSLDEAGLAADNLLQAHILTADRPLSFVHPLVATAVYNDLLPGQRSTLHRRAADVLRGEEAPPDRIATHLAATEPAGLPEVVDVLTAAARSALSNGASDVAIVYLRRALAEPPPPDQRLGVLLELGAVEAFAADPGAIDHLAEAMPAIDDPATRIMLATARGLALALEGRPAEAIAGLDGLGDDVAGDRGLHIQLLAATVLVGLTGPDAASLVADHAAELLEAVGPETDAEASVLGVRAFAGAFANEPATVVADMAARALRSLSNDDPTLPVWFHLPVAALIMADRDAEAAEAVENGLALARRLGAPVHLAVTQFLRSWLALRAGELDDAEVDARASIETLALHGVEFLTPGPVAVLVDVLRERDEIDAASAVLQDHDVIERPHESLFDQLLVAARGRLLAAQGRWELAAAQFENGLDRTRACGCVSPGFIPWHGHLVLAHVGGQRVGASTIELAQTARQLGDAFGSPRARAEGLRAVAWADPTASDDLVDEAARLFAEAGDKLEEARMLIGVSYARQGRTSKAKSRVMLSTALELGERVGSVRVQALANEYLDRLGVTPHRRAVIGPESLTPSERRVAVLAANGLTNKAIAQELFVSVKTVETHLSHSFQKLVISSRDDLEAALSPVPA